jgi:hypothetical protein
MLRLIFVRYRHSRPQLVDDQRKARLAVLARIGRSPADLVYARGKSVLSPALRTLSGVTKSLADKSIRRVHPQIASLLIWVSID